ncbi:hypothetical protein [Microbulbifer guangxiensis]|uniref:hypothetical protein n=1 Tax=Microbulbifer guangxiensis TaxID=2904249 RepID=UPI001F1FCF00|nr:hypothetical protein [Microbulbifer guangxiensis]
MEQVQEHHEQIVYGEMNRQAFFSRAQNHEGEPQQNQDKCFWLPLLSGKFLWLPKAQQHPYRQRPCIDSHSQPWNFATGKIRPERPKTASPQPDKCCEGKKSLDSGHMLVKMP